MNKKKKTEPQALPLSEDILVVEDSRLLQSIIKKNLSSFTSSSLIQARDGEEAFNIVMERPYVFKVILLDLALPKMNGLQFVEKLRALPGPKSDTTVISVTGNQNNLSQAELRNAQLNGVIIKPIDFQSIFYVLTNLPVPSADHWFGIVNYMV